MALWILYISYKYTYLFAIFIFPSIISIVSFFYSYLTYIDSLLINIFIMAINLPNINTFIIIIYLKY